MAPTVKFLEIKHDEFRKAREKSGLSISDLSKKACLSVRQIEQIENGEMSSFYGMQVKITAAKKVAELIGLAYESAFNLDQQEPQINALTPVKKDSPAPELDKSASKKQEKERKLKPKLPTKTIDDAEKNEAVNVMGMGNVQSVFKAKSSAFTKLSSNQAIAGTHKNTLFIGIAFAATCIVLVIYFQSNFFNDSHKEKEDVIAGVLENQPTGDARSTEEEKPMGALATPVPTIVAPAVASISPNDCPTADPSPITYKPEFPKKSAGMVYLQSKSVQTICVIDALDKVQLKQLEPGVGVSAYGKPPFRILTSGLDQIDLYFQGVKVRPSNKGGKTIILESAEYIQPEQQSDVR